MKLSAAVPAGTGAMFLASLLLGITGPAAAQSRPGSIYLRAGAGVTTQSLKDFNNSLKDYESAKRAAGIPLQWDTFGPTFHPRGEIGYVVTDLVAVGVEVGYQRSKLENKYADGSGSVADDLETRMYEVTGNVSFQIPTAPGLFVGANAGMGFGKLTENFRFRDFADTTNNLAEKGDWDGSGPIVGVFAGYERRFGPGVLLFARGGYEYRNLGKFDGSHSSTLSDPKQGPPRGQNGDALDSDYSGVYIVAGTGFSFGIAPK